MKRATLVLVGFIISSATRTEACAKIKATNFPPSQVAFDAAFARE